jgi:hypothetical protein
MLPILEQKDAHDDEHHAKATQIEPEFTRNSGSGRIRSWIGLLAHQ